MQFYVTQYVYTSHKNRMLHFFIDNFMLYFIPFAIVMIIGPLRNGVTVYEFNATDPTGQSPGFPGIIAWIYYFGFYLFFEGVFGKTPGKFITRSRVVDDYGEKPPFEHILLRTLFRLVPFETFSFLGTWCRGWHDRFSYTYVVSEDDMKAAKAEFENQPPTPNTQYP